MQNECVSGVSVLMLSSGYEPLFRTNWKRAIGAVIGGRAEVIETYEKVTIGTPSGPYPLPAIVRFTGNVIAAKIKKLNRRARLTRYNLYLRDKGKCQYCNDKLSFDESTVDHVIPKCRGGSHTWNNVALACSQCNQKKGSSLLKETGMKLKVLPCAPAVNKLLCSSLNNIKNYN
jgi:5-methylcytosine-specific restriction endonuclease McrA